MSEISTAGFSLSFQSGHGAIAELRGALDIGIARELSEIIIDKLDKGYDVELNVAGLEFVDSTGLWALLACHRHARSLGRLVTFTGPLRSQPRRLLRVTGLAHEFFMSDTEG